MHMMKLKKTWVRAGGAMYPCNLKKVRNAISKRGGTFSHMKTELVSCA